MTTARIPCDQLFYVRVANDIQGIGYQRTPAGETFDLGSNAPLEGIAFLNDFPYWQTRPDEYRSAFLHETGHRWGVRVRARQGEVDYDLTDGSGHWNYFLDAQGSPLEGNAFSHSDPAFTQTPRFATHYSPLDLYLMGALPADEVEPTRLLLEVESPGQDCRGRPLSSASPPQRCGAKTLTGRWLPVTAQDIVRSEGPRHPDASGAADTLRVAFVVFGEPEHTWSASACKQLARSIDERLRDFSAATDGRIELVNAISNTSASDTNLGGGAGSLGEASSSAMFDCERLSQLSAPPPAKSGCQHAASGAPPNQGWLLAAIGLLTAVARVRWRIRRVAYP